MTVRAAAVRSWEPLFGRELPSSNILRPPYSPPSNLAVYSRVHYSVTHYSV